MVCTGCSGIEREQPAANATPIPTTPAPVTAAALSTEFEALRTQAGGRLSIAWAPVGRPDAVQSLGSVADEQAWSTIKAPVAVAALKGGDGANLAKDLDLALTISDNDAARRLWRSLGPDAQAGAAVDAVLARAGDRTTRAGQADGKPVSFGLTRWTVPDAARFATGLPCLSEVGPVWKRMGRVADEQRWGLGRVGGAHFKGGWGPSPNGYLMRQVGVLPRADGSQVAVAIATQPPGDSHEAGAAALDGLTRWFDGEIGPSDGGRCGT